MEITNICPYCGREMREGADPGAVLFDSLQAAKARNVDVVFCDTAGRLHNKANLMQERGVSKVLTINMNDMAKELNIKG